MREVSIIGAGLVPFGKYPEKTLADIAWPAVKQAVEDSGLKKTEIEAAYCGTALGGMMAGQRILKKLGITGLPIINIENACSSSSTAFREAWISVAAGVYDSVLVIGVEKLTKFGGGTLPLEKEDWEVSHGLVMPALYAMRARRYMHEYGLTEDQLAKVSVAELRYGVDAILPEEASEIPPMRRMTDLLDYCADRARSIGKNDIGVAIDIILEKCKADDSRHPTDRRFDDYSGEERRSQGRR